MTAPAETTSVRALSPEPTPYAIEVNGLNVRIGTEFVIRNLSMHVPRGAIYGLIGPSGAGKTTLFRALATVQRPNSGSIRIEGVDACSNPAAARGRIGFLPDTSGVYEDLTAREYLDFYASLYSVAPGKRRQSVDELLELMNLWRARDHPVRSLSRGAKQQLGLARCLIHDPDVLLLDEPGAGMDPRTRLELRDTLTELSRFGKTILICSHVLPDLSSICTCLGVMRDGAVIAEGDTDQVLQAIAPDPLLCVNVLHSSDLETARKILEDHPATKRIEDMQGSSLRVRFTGGHQDLASVLALMLRSGVLVSEFSLQRPTVEDVYMQATAARTQP